MSNSTQVGEPQPLRWGFVGTGNIANWMAAVVQRTPLARLSAVASRSSDKAAAFAARHGAGKAFGEWTEMLSWEGIDAVYVATPTALREQICVAAANAGKHVLGEKPFADLASLGRIITACRDNGVAFMDATHFPHHPRTAEIRTDMDRLIGTPLTLDSSFMVNMADRSDIRYDPALEPLGALGDLGWYNMRATQEYLAPGTGLGSVSARLRRDETSGAIVAAEGRLVFTNGAVSTWRCAFDAQVTRIGLKLAGRKGQIRLDNFVGEDEAEGVSYHYSRAGPAERDAQQIPVDSRFSGPALMFQDFAAAAHDRSLREPWEKASEQTQALLDAAREADRR